MAAEGIETATIQARLEALGCSDAQGWLYAKALSPEDVDRMFAPGNRPGDEPIAVAN
jgi:EAL domain-containing protein (putative c-di-GMP-specific phosphodiesterase class I)